MRAVVVVSHPDRGSFVRALADRAVAGLGAGGHHVDLLDLDAEGFRATMSPAERAAYHGDEPILDPVVQRHADLVRAAEILVFVYPHWWSGMPARLKGWLERVLVPGVAFRFDDAGKVRPGLPQVRHLVGVCTYGSPRWYVRLVNDNGRRIVTRALRMSCGFRARPSWLGLYAVDTSTADERAEFLARVEREMADLR